MFERYTEQARRALFFARYEASALGSVTIDAPHLLLGVMKEDHGLISTVFSSRGLTYASVRDTVEAGRVKLSTSVEMPFSQAAKTALNAAAAEADRLNHSYIGVEHLLLGVLAEGNSNAAAQLIARGLDVDTARKEVVTLLKETSALAPAPPTARYQFGEGRDLLHRRKRRRFRGGTRRRSDLAGAVSNRARQRRLRVVPAIDRRNVDRKLRLRANVGIRRASEAVLDAALGWIAQTDGV